MDKLTRAKSGCLQQPQLDASPSWQVDSSSLQPSPHYKDSMFALKVEYTIVSGSVDCLQIRSLPNTFLVGLIALWFLNQSDPIFPVHLPYLIAGSQSFSPKWNPNPPLPFGLKHHCCTPVSLFCNKIRLKITLLLAYAAWLSSLDLFQKIWLDLRSSFGPDLMSHL